MTTQANLTRAAVLRPVSCGTITQVHRSFRCRLHRDGTLPPMQHADSHDSLSSLVGQALAGDDSAWNALVARLERVVWKAVHMVTSDLDLQEEAFAATWLAAARHLGAIRDPEYLPGWLYKTAVNEVRGLVRRQSGHAVVSLDDPRQHVVLRGLFFAEDDRDRVSEAENALIWAAFERLNDRCRELRQSGA